MAGMGRPTFPQRAVRSRAAQVAGPFFALGLFAAAGCGEIGEPDYGLGSFSSETSVVGVDEQSQSPTTEVVDAVAVAQVFTPPRPEGYTPDLLIASDAGLELADPAGTSRAAVTGLVASFSPRQVETAVDEFFGGVVVELSGSEVRWFPDVSGESSQVGVVGDELLDVGFLDETIQVYVFVESVTGTIDRIRLADGERSMFAMLGPGQSVLDFSASDGLQVAAIDNDQCGALIFYNATGAEADVGGPREPACTVLRRPNYGAVALSPDATSVTYTEIAYRSDGVIASTELVIRELGTQVELLRLAVGSPGQSVTGLSFDGNRIAFVRTDSDGAEAVVVDVDLAVVDGALSSTYETIVRATGQPIEASFARQPLAVGR